jgi:hypothetical protein
VTQLIEPDLRQDRDVSTPRGRDERSGRWMVVLALIVALACCGFADKWASEWKSSHRAGTQSAAAERGALGGMNSYSLALMLGGLRGPLVMILWSKVENQKIGRDLEDVDTMIEWIRLLQPEFDTVHIFQIWNKAYNISAMMASSASKYTTILDAIDYARRVDAERPGDLNILDQLGRVFGEKVGGPNVSERFFYRKQFREDSMTDASRMKVYPEDNATYRRMGIKFFNGKNGPLLREDGTLLPELENAQAPRPAELPANKEWNDGAELQYLRQYQPFPYGLDPLAMGYNYAKRAQVIMTTSGQKPLQLSESVLDSYPGLLLRQWAEREQERAWGFEAKAFARPGDEQNPVALAAASPLGATPASAAGLDGEVYSYTLAARLCSDAITEYTRHTANTEYINPNMSYAAQLDDLKALQFQTSGDRDYAAAFLPGADRARLLAQAGASYRQSLSEYERIILKYYIEARIIPKLFPTGHNESDMLNEADLDKKFGEYLHLVGAIEPAGREYEEERAEYARSMNRSGLRLQQLSTYSPKSILQLR